jgi:predicted Zn-dependent protease
LRYGLRAIVGCVAAPRSYLFAVQTARTLLSGLLAALAACSTNPATGERQLSLISRAQEIEIGEQGAQEVTETIGVVDDARVQRYVAGIGERLAARSEQPELPWSFALIDDPTPNAFALPGGKIFVTRGLFVHIANEAQLASVLGHEIGHVTARHSVERLSKAQLTELGLGLGAVLFREGRGLVPIAAAGMQVLFLKFSRDDEYQADELGLRYAARGGYEVGEMPDVFRMLERVSEAEGGGRIPEWMATHPNPENRVERIADEIAERGVQTGTGKIEAERYVRRAQGLVYGPDPRDGFFRGDRFHHPGLRFSIAMPEGWQRANYPEAVIAASPDDDALVQLTKSAERDPDAALAIFARQSGARGVEPADVIDTLPSASASFAADAEEGALRGIVTYVALGEHTFEILSLSPEARFDQHARTFQRIHASFEPLSDPALLNVKPARIELIDVKETTRLSALYEQSPASIPLERIALLNQLEPDAQVKAGQLLKWVRGGEGMDR